jgi:hypothetical protein
MDLDKQQLKKRQQIMKYVSCIIIILLIGITLLPGITVRIKAMSIQADLFSIKNQAMQKDNNDYDEFTFAIIWGKYEVMKDKIFLFHLEVMNPNPDNRTISVLGYVDYEHKFVFKKSNWIDCFRWSGFIGHDHLFIIAWNTVYAY